MERSSNSPTLHEVLDTFRKWLELAGDTEFIETILAARCDRKISGDSVWLFIVGHSGGTKTESVRALSGNDIYTLDSLTDHTFVSGKIEEGKPVKGILSQLDGKILVIKDFSVILSMREEVRNAIFSQLRALHDGYLECGYGTLNEPIRVHANIGIIAACTPHLDSYGKMNAVLGDRFLRLRHDVDDRKTLGLRAAKNLGKEEEMRTELQTVTSRFVDGLRFKAIAPTEDQEKIIVDMACATSVLRSHVMMKFWKNEVTDYEVAPNREYPTRLTKQFLKLSILLANVRGHNEIEIADLKTVQRVARDTCIQPRLKIVRHMIKEGKVCSSKQVADGTGIPRTTVWRELKEMQYIGLVDYDEGIKDLELDGWQLKEPEQYRILFDDLESIPVSQNTLGRYLGNNNVGTALSCVLCETTQQPLAVTVKV
jgi:hypothetical protein